MVFKIAKTELKNLFYSPIAWFILIVFMIQCAFVYMGLIDRYAQIQESSSGHTYLTELTKLIFIEQGGVFETIMEKLYLFIPLLTMGLISREINNGTIKLLYSSPVKVREIVLGKYVAMLIYSALLVSIIGFFMVAGFFHIRSFDSGTLLSAVLGFYLLLSSYSAIGLFMSSLTTYQVVAAISTFVVIGAMSYIGTVWQDIDFVRDLTYFLSSSSRAETMLGGLITTKDVLYFVIIICSFLAFTILKLKAGRESKSFVQVASRYAVVIVSALVLGYITSRPQMIGYLDTTRNQKNTLTPEVQSIIKQFGNEKLEVTSYNNLLDPSYFYLGLPVTRNDFLSVWEPYLRFKPGIDFKFVNYYDTAFNNPDMKKDLAGKTLKQIAEAKAKDQRVDFSIFKSPAQIHKLVNLRAEDNKFVMQLKYKGRTTFLRVFNDPQVFPGETEVAASFKRLLLAKFPKIVFVTGDLERNIHRLGERDYTALSNLSDFRYSLINQGFDVVDITLNSQNIPSDASTLVIADPKTALSITALSKIEGYIAKGGNMLIAGEPGKQALLNPLLEKLGVQLMTGTIVQPDPDHSPDLTLSNLTSFASTFSKPLNYSFLDSVVVSMPNATGISYANKGPFAIKPLLVTDRKLSWIKKDKFLTDSATIVFSAKDGDIRESIATVAALTRQLNGKQQRIIVSGDSDFMSNTELKRWNMRTSNFLFTTGIFSWLSYGAFPIEASRPRSEDNRMKVTTKQVAFQKVIFTWVVPGLFLVFATVLLIRRKRK